jgi:hypothetical protein
MLGADGAALHKRDGEVASGAAALLESFNYSRGLPAAARRLCQALRQFAT